MTTKPIPVGVIGVNPGLPTQQSARDALRLRGPIDAIGYSAGRSMRT